MTKRTLVAVAHSPGIAHGDAPTPYRAKAEAWKLDSAAWRKCCFFPVSCLRQPRAVVSLTSTAINRLEWERASMRQPRNSINANFLQSLYNVDNLQVSA